MMKALIKGTRIVQVTENEFPVHPDYQWQNVANDVTTEWTWNGSEAVPPEPEPPEEVEQRQEEQLRREAEKVIQELTVKRLIDDTEIPDDDKRRIIGMYVPWKVGIAVILNERRRYEGALYECLQAHTTQADWTPPATPALWNEIVAPGTIGAWVQPTGAHDAYPLNAKVTHNGETWISLVDANVWEPQEGTPALWAIVD